MDLLGRFVMVRSVALKRKSIKDPLRSPVGEGKDGKHSGTSGGESNHPVTVDPKTGGSGSGVGSDSGPAPDSGAWSGSSWGDNKGQPSTQQGVKPDDGKHDAPAPA